MNAKQLEARLDFLLWSIASNFADCVFCHVKNCAVWIGSKARSADRRLDEIQEFNDKLRERER